MLGLHDTTDLSILYPYTVVASKTASLLRLTGADGAMTAEGALDDPSIFEKAVAHVQAENEQLRAEIKWAKTLKEARRKLGRQFSTEEKAIVKQVAALRKEAHALQLALAEQAAEAAKRAQRAEA